METDVIGMGGVECRVSIPRGRKARYDEIVAAANEEGAIQAGDARDLFSSAANHHTMSLSEALRIAGFSWEEI